MTGAEQRGTVSPADFEYIRTLLRERAAIQLDADKAYRIEGALLPVARQEGFDSVASLVGKLRTGPVNGLHQKVVEAMTINETTFFRDIYPFEALRREIVPGFLQRPTAPRLDVWCAACSTGQEPYSVAMMLRENFPTLAEGATRIVATDLCGAALERARKGEYSQLEVNRGLPAPLLVKYFQRGGLNWRLADSIRNRVDFQQLNLIQPWSLTGQFDVVFLRNVLIYFDVESRRQILTRVRRLLRPAGVLFLGGAETTLQLSNDFDRVPFDRHAYYRVRAF